MYVYLYWLAGTVIKAYQDLLNTELMVCDLLKHYFCGDGLFIPMTYLRFNLSAPFQTIDLHGRINTNYHLTLFCARPSYHISQVDASEFLTN